MNLSIYLQEFQKKTRRPKCLVLKPSDFIAGELELTSLRYTKQDAELCDKVVCIIPNVIGNSPITIKVLKERNPNTEEYLFIERPNTLTY